MKHRGSCHCGKVAYEVEGDITYAITCNCSMCQRKGSVLWFAPRKDFRLLTSESDVSAYTFNKHKIKHHFCRHCGIHPFALGEDGQGNPMAAINLRCLENFDFEKVPTRQVNGREF